MINKLIAKARATAQWMLTKAQDTLEQSDEWARAIDTLGIGQHDLDLIHEIRNKTRKGFALGTLGLSEMDLKDLKVSREEQKMPLQTRVLRLIGPLHSFRKFLTWAMWSYYQYKKLHKSKWKALSEEELVSNLKRDLNSDKFTDADIFNVVLGSYFLYWKKHFSKEAQST